MTLLALTGLIPDASAAPLVLREDSAAQTLVVLREGAPTPLLTHHVPIAARPYIHPLTTPDGATTVTGAAGTDGRAAAGLYWALGDVNGRDYAANAGSSHWRRVSVRVIANAGDEVKWATVYELLDAAGRPLMRETQTWAARVEAGQLGLDFEWSGQALTDLEMGAGKPAGLVLHGAGTVINSNRQSDQRAHRERAVWLEVRQAGADGAPSARIAMFDHPRNDGYPLAWRVDASAGIGPSRSLLGAWRIARDRTVTFRHRLLVHTGALDDVKLHQAWRTYTGEPSDRALWVLARDESKLAEFLTGEQAVAKMTVADGFEVKLYAEEPAITQPIAFCWDDRGRLWVAQNRDYETRSRGFANSGDSSIVILEDTDGDGRMDRRKVFLEGIPFPTGIAVGFDGLWLGAPPNLLFVPDRDRDDQPDGNIEIRLTGWGIQDRHEPMNSFMWGPDGWLYGCQGVAVRSRVGKPAPGARISRAGEPFPENPPVLDPQYLDGGIWRYHPTKDRFEIVAHGFSNPWGLDFDDHGQMFITACVIPHLWHVIPGGIYHRQGGLHINPHVYEDIDTIADHRHRSAHGGARIYLADEFPQEYRGRIFMANIHEHALLTDILEPRGSGFVGRHGDDPVLANDPQWVGFSIELGPDGAIYMLDWHDADICGISVDTKETGRIFRFAPRGLRAPTNLNLAALSDLELVELQQHRNDWYVRRARLQLQQRATESRLDPRVADRLWAQFDATATAAGKLRALWALHVTNCLPPARLIALLDHPAAPVRAWAVQLLGEDLQVNPEAGRRFAELARSDPSPVVRLHLASALQRLPAAERWPIAAGLLAHAEDADDHNLPKMIWFGIEPLVMQDPARALELALAGKISRIARFVARRATAGNRLEVIASVLAGPGPIAGRTAVLEGLRDGLAARDRTDVRPPANWPAVEATFRDATDAGGRELFTEVVRLLGDVRAATEQLAQLQDEQTPVARRRDILAGLARDAYPPAGPVALALLDHPALRRDALRALSAFDNPRIPTEILRRYPTWTAEEKAEAILTLANRRANAEQVLAGLREGVIPRRDISAFAARQLQRVVGQPFLDVWGPVNEPAGEAQAEMARLKAMLTDDLLDRADLANGRELFARTCAACHLLYGEGGRIGPDLTGSNRGNLDYILTEIMVPSDVIPEAYQLVTLRTRDGRTLAGNIAAEDEQQVTMRLIGQEVVVPRSQIVARDNLPVSMMPDGLLRGMSDDEIRDLIAYLRTTRQVPQAPKKK